MSLRGILTRLEKTGLQTLGRLVIYDGLNKIYECCTIERAWSNNKANVSCIPVGTYKCLPRTSAKYNEHYHVTEVPRRSYILIHVANYSNQLEGCIGVGSSFLDINADGLIDVINSTGTLKGLIQATKNQPFDLTII